MAIDWFTVIAQALNFLILIFFMKRFLYKPILNAIDTREKRVAAELASAAAKMAEARKESEEFTAKNEQFDQQRSALLKKATDEMLIESQRLLNEARVSAGELSKKGKEALKAEEQSLRESIRRRIRSEVFAITQKALTDLADITLEEQMVHLFCRRLRELSVEEKGKLTGAHRRESGSVVVQTTTDLEAAQREAIETVIKEVFGAEAQVSFEISPDLISGIELSANGHKSGWNIADYLKSLESSIEELPAGKGGPRPKSPRAPGPEMPQMGVSGKENGI